MLKINIEYKKGILFVRLCGNLTLSTAKEFNKYIIPLIKRNGIRFLVYNLTNINIIDYEGIKTLKMGEELIYKNNGKFLICNPTEELKEDFKIIKNELEALSLIRV